MNRRSFLSKLAVLPLAVPAAMHAARRWPVGARGEMVVTELTIDCRPAARGVAEYQRAMDRARAATRRLMMATDKMRAANTRAELALARSRAALERAGAAV